MIQRSARPASGTGTPESPATETVSAGEADEEADEERGEEGEGLDERADAEDVEDVEADGDGPRVVMRGSPVLGTVLTERYVQFEQPRRPGYSRPRERRGTSRPAPS
jgi:hypothetical protein